MNYFFLPCFLLVLCLSLVSCSPEQKSLQIDNPSYETFEIKFEGNKKIVIPPNTKDEIMVPFEKQKVEINGAIFEIELDDQKDYLLNPSLATYYIEEIYYFISPKMEKEYFEEHYNPKSKVEGFEVDAEITKIENVLLIEKNWFFDLDAAPSTGMRTNNDGMVKMKKIHRAEDLLSKIRYQLSTQFENAKLELKLNKK